MKLNSAAIASHLFMKSETIQKKYQIIQTLGQNSLTQTFLARGRGLKYFQRYIIKKFRFILGNPQTKAIHELFHQEANALQILGGEHPQIPRIDDYFVDGADFYLVREWIEGMTLAQKVQQQGKFSEAEVKQILSSILSVLEYIHDFGLVYRELSPSSIVLRQPQRLFWIKNQAALAVPIYFSGIKKLESAALHLKQTVLIFADQQEYSPPEQEQGQSVYASDFYSLGLTAIYLLTGKTPSKLKVDPYENKLLWHQECPNLSSNLARVINRAIYTDSSDRFVSAQEMSKALFPESINISESLINQSAFDSELKLDTKIVIPILALGLGIIGLGFAMLNFNFSSNKIQQDLVRSLHSNQSNSIQVKENPFFPSQSRSQSANLTNSNNIDSVSIPVLNLPIFPIGTSEEHLITYLGEPSLKSKGYWQDSTAFLYQDLIAQQVDLGYLSDARTKTILQAEIFFAESVNGIEVQQAMRQLLMTNYSVAIAAQIEQVINQKSDKQEFTVNNLAGIIQRNSQNQIYISVWQLGFHP